MAKTDAQTRPVLRERHVLLSRHDANDYSGSRPPNQRNVSSSDQAPPKDDAVASRIAALEADGLHGAKEVDSVPLPSNGQQIMEGAE